MNVKFLLEWHQVEIYFLKTKLPRWVANFPVLFAEFFSVAWDDTLLVPRCLENTSTEWVDLLLSGAAWWTLRSGCWAGLLSLQASSWILPSAAKSHSCLCVCLFKGSSLLCWVLFCFALLAEMRFMGWPQTHRNPPFSTSWELGLQLSAITLSSSQVLLGVCMSVSCFSELPLLSLWDVLSALRVTPCPEAFLLWHRLQLSN